MKKLFLFFMFMFIFCNTSYAKSVEFSVVSDTYLEVDNSTKYADKMTPSINTLLGAIDQINKSPAQFSIFLGDNLAKADKYSLVMFSKILRKLDKPVYVGIGDKDVAQTKDIDKKEYYRILNIFSQNRISELPQAKKINGFVFIFTDGINQFIPSQWGYFKENEIQQIDKLLTKYKKYPVVIVGHYPIYAAAELGESKLPHKIENYQKMLSNHDNVIAIISGHHNIEDEFLEGKIYNIYTQSLGKTAEFKKISIDYDNGTKKAFIKTRIYKVE